MRRSRVFRWCGAATALTVFAAPASSAIYYEMTTSTSTPGFGGDMEMDIHSYIDGDSGRIEFVSSDDEVLFAEGGYLLTQDAGGTIYLVNPAEQTYMTFDLDALLGMAGNVMNAMGGIMEMSFENVASENLGEQPGGELLGYPTTLYSFGVAYDMSITVMGFTRTTRTESRTQVWCTHEISAPAFGVWLRPDRMRTGNEDLDALISQQMQMPDCLPLRIVSVSSADGAGETRSETIVTTLREEASFDAGMFVLPADYTETSILDQIELPEGVELPEGFSFTGGAAPGASTDAAGTQAQPAEAAEQQEEEAEEEDDRPFGRFRNLIGR